MNSIPVYYVVYRSSTTALPFFCQRLPEKCCRAQKQTRLEMCVPPFSSQSTLYYTPVPATQTRLYNSDYFPLKHSLRRNAILFKQFIFKWLAFNSVDNSHFIIFPYIPPANQKVNLFMSSYGGTFHIEREIPPNKAIQSTLILVLTRGQTKSPNFGLPLLAWQSGLKC